MPYCNNCGKEIPENLKFCPYCGSSTKLTKEAKQSISAIEPKNEIKKGLLSKRNIAVIGIIFVITYLIGAGLSRSPSSLTPTTPTTTPTPTPTQLTWKLLDSWRGEGIINTQTFQIQGGQWRIKWWSNGTQGLIQIFVYNDKGNLVSLAANQQTPATGESYLYQKGSFYLKINTANTKWIIIVEEELPQDKTPIKNVLSTNWSVLKTWSGSGIKNTEKFNINKEYWRVTWDLQGNGVLQIMVYNDASDLENIVGNIKSGSGYSYIYAPKGTYYLTINSANVNYKITVEVTP